MVNVRRKSIHGFSVPSFIRRGVRGGGATAVTKHFNLPHLTARRRALRKNLPKAEAILWKRLSKKQLLGLKFRRQYSVDQYIVDFYCPELKLAVEIDGESHIGDADLGYDRRREDHIKEFGITFLRFPSTDVYANLDGVLQAISEGATRLLQQRREA